MPLDTTASKWVPRLTERANPAILSSRKCHLSNRDETYETPRQHVHTDDASPVTADVQVTAPQALADATPATTPGISTPSLSTTNGPEELDIADEINSVNTSTNTTDGPLPVAIANETPETQLSTLP